MNQALGVCLAVMLCAMAAGETAAAPFEGSRVLALAAPSTPAAPAKEKKPGKGKAKKESGKKKGGRSKVTVTADIGIGPALNTFTGAVADDQFFHYGLKLDVAAIIDQETIRQNQHRVPARYRSMAAKMKEFTYRPFWWLPDSLLLSPKVDHGDCWGVTFRPIGLGFSLLDTSFLKFSLSAGAVLTAAYLSNDRWVSEQGFEADWMFLLRPGVDLKAELLLAISRPFVISLGWDSHLYVPQTIGRTFWDSLGDNLLEDSIWHQGQAFLLLHFRFPYTTTF